MKNLRTLSITSKLGDQEAMENQLMDFYRKTMFHMHDMQQKHNGRAENDNIEFDYLIVIDFEATCVASKTPTFQLRDILFFFKFPCHHHFMLFCLQLFTGKRSSSFRQS